MLAAASVQRKCHRGPARGCLVTRPARGTRPEVGAEKAPRDAAAGRRSAVDLGARARWVRAVAEPSDEGKVGDVTDVGQGQGLPRGERVPGGYDGDPSLGHQFLAVEPGEGVERGSGRRGSLAHPAVCHRPRRIAREPSSHRVALRQHTAPGTSDLQARRPPARSVLMPSPAGDVRANPARCFFLAPGSLDGPTVRGHKAPASRAVQTLG